MSYSSPGAFARKIQEAPLLRDKSLIPLSHQHQRALALCVRIDRAAPILDTDLEAWQSEITQLFQQEIAIHFAAEEDVLFSAARKFAELAALVEELLAEHVILRGDFSRAEARAMSADSLQSFAQRLSAHIRKEERQLFQRLQELMRPVELTALGAQLENALKDSAQACQLPNETTRLRAAK